MNPLGIGDPLRLGPYRLLGVLGEGGMGKVYLGQDGTGRTAAVKVLRPDLAHDLHLAQRFVREAQMAQAVTSKGVARVLGSQTEGGRPWIASEFLAGPTLDEAVSTHGPLDESAVRALATALARTLDDIHASGLVHRDLKPANIVLTSAGPRVIDFGIARPEHGLTLTTTGQVPVTPGYGAPEQILGQRVGPPADVFSLGAVLVHASSGRLAFDAGHVAAVQYEVVHGQPDLSQVPIPLQPLIGPCLAKDAAMRPVPGQIAAAFAPPRSAERIGRQGALAAEIKTREINIRRLTTQAGPDDTPGVSRRRLLTTLAAGGTVLAGGGTATWWLRHGTGAWSAAGDKEAGPFDIPPAVQTPYAAMLNVTEGEITVEPGAQLTPLWGPLGRAADDSPPPLAVRDVVVVGARGGGLSALSVVNGKERWAAHDVEASGRFVSLSDQLIAAIGPGGRLVTFVASSGARKWTAPAQARSVLAADEEMVYVATEDGRLRAVGRSDATIRWTASTSADLLTKIRPRGIAARGRLIFCAENGDIVAVDTRNGGKAWEFPSEAKIIDTPTIHEDRVFFGGKNLTAVRISDGKEIWSNKPQKDYRGNWEYWSSPTIHNNSVYAMRGNYTRKVRVEDGSYLWTRAARGSAWSPVLHQGSYAWIVTDIPDLTALEPSMGKSLLSYRPHNGAQIKGLAADGNRVFVMANGQLTALPVL